MSPFFAQASNEDVARWLRAFASDERIVRMPAKVRWTMLRAAELLGTLDDAINTMNICIREYQELQKVAIDGDTDVAYQLGVRHGELRLNAKGVGDADQD